MPRAASPADALEDVLRLQKRIVLTRKDPNKIAEIMFVSAMVPACDIDKIESISSLKGAHRVTVAEFRANANSIMDTVHLGSVVIVNDKKPVAALLSPTDLQTLRHCDAQEVSLNWDDVENHDRPDQSLSEQSAKLTVH